MLTLIDPQPRLLPQPVRTSPSRGAELLAYLIGGAITGLAYYLTEPATDPGRLSVGSLAPLDCERLEPTRRPARLRVRSRAPRERLLTTAEAARYLAYRSPSGIRSAMSRGVLRRAGVDTKGRNLFRKRDLDTYAAKHRRR